MKMPMTVLIVDDEEIVRKMIRVTLKGFGDVVFLEANDAAGALKEFQEYLRLDPKGSMAQGAEAMVSKIQNAVTAKP